VLHAARGHPSTMIAATLGYAGTPCASGATADPPRRGWPHSAMRNAAVAPRCLPRSRSPG
jgi:hypothetical protein